MIRGRAVERAILEGMDRRLGRRRRAAIEGGVQLVVVGDGDGVVGAGYGKAGEVPEAIRKAIERARMSLLRVPLIEGTLPHEIIGRFGAAKVLLRPASSGTGVIAGGPVRAVLESAGVKDVLTKTLGTNNPNNVVRATMTALDELRDPVERKRQLERA